LFKFSFSLPSVNRLALSPPNREEWNTQNATKDTEMVSHVPDAELANLYSAASCKVLPSLREGYGIPIGEGKSAETLASAIEFLRA
jgi:glycosyltransferase involved in cell wall biosynthesis